MIEHNGKFAGVVIRADQLHYVLAEALGKKLLVTGGGSLDAREANPEAFSPLAGRRILCGIESCRCSQRKVVLHENNVIDDPDHLMWELSRSYTEPLQNYCFSFTKQHPSGSTTVVNTRGVRKESAESVGRFFDARNLVLEKMIMEPEAIRQVMKKVIDSDRSIALVVESGQVHLQIFRQRQLICHQSIALTSDVNQEMSQRLAEEIGVLLLNHLGGQPMRRDVTLLLLGNEQGRSIADAMTSALPYDFKLRRLELAAFDCDVAKDVALDWNQYFLPFSLAYLYNVSRQCESSPEKNVVWR